MIYARVHRTTLMIVIRACYGFLNGKAKEHSRPFGEDRMLAQIHIPLAVAAMLAAAIAGSGFAIFALAPSALAAQQIIHVQGGLALSGYDPVSYHVDGRPSRGKAEFETVWMGAAWRFASQENLDAFLSDPERYAPAYGGHCAYAVSKGSLQPGDPTIWRIVDDRLYLNLSPSTMSKWEADIPGSLAKAERNWPELSE